MEHRLPGTLVTVLVSTLTFAVCLKPSPPGGIKTGWVQILRRLCLSGRLPVPNLSRQPLSAQKTHLAQELLVVHRM